MTTSSSSAQTTKAADVARAYIEAVGRRERDAQLRFYAPGARGRIHGVIDSAGLEEMQAFFAELYDAFPDYRMELLDVVEDGDQAVVRWQARATFSGPGSFMGLRPTGRAVELDGMDMIWVKDGKIERVEAYTDGMSLARQLGALPPKDSPPERAMFAALNGVTRAREALESLRSRR